MMETRMPLPPAAEDLPRVRGRCTVKTPNTPAAPNKQLIYVFSTSFMCF